jgi:phage shock protein C
MKEGLQRSRRNRIFGGVAAGLGDYLKIDPIIVRVLFVVSTFLSGIGILLYIILWIVVPEENLFTVNPENITNGIDQSEGINTEDIFKSESITDKSSNSNIVIGIILIIVGLFFLGVEVFSFLNFSDLFPILAVGVGIGLIYNSLKSR